MSRKGAETQRDAHGFALTRWVNACLLASASSLRLCAFARHPIAGFRITRIAGKSDETNAFHLLRNLLLFTFRLPRSIRAKPIGCQN